MVIAQILVAAGNGARIGGEIPKQYRPLNGKPLICHTLDALENCAVDQHIVVYSEAHSDLLEQALNDIPFNVTRVVGGATRTASVRAGLLALSKNPPDIVFIHDAARPFISPHIVKALTAALLTHQSAVPVLMIPDAVKSFDANTVGPDIDRSTLRRVQTPQAFRFSDIWAAYQSVDETVSYADDIAVAHNYGLSIATVDGDDDNFKVTYPSDLKKAEHMLQPSYYSATGHGYDVHQYCEGNRIWLCGVEIPAAYSLKGHSDADVGLHALTDAILGAIAFGDIGDHFPPSDPKWKGASSDKFLKFASESVAERGGRIEHVDVTLICEKPKVKPHRAAMRKRISEILDLPLGRVSIKATTTEKLGFTGREEGLAAQATATVSLPRDQ